MNVKRCCHSDVIAGVDSLIENALNNQFTNVLVEPNCVNWDVE